MRSAIQPPGVAASARTSESAPQAIGSHASGTPISCALRMRKLSLEFASVKTAMRPRSGRSAGGTGPERESFFAAPSGIEAASSRTPNATQSTDNKPGMSVAPSTSRTSPGRQVRIAVATSGPNTAPRLSIAR